MLKKMIIFSVVFLLASSQAMAWKTVYRQQDGNVTYIDIQCNNGVNFRIFKGIKANDPRFFYQSGSGDVPHRCSRVAHYQVGYVASSICKCIGSN